MERLPPARATRSRIPARPKCPSARPGRAAGSKPQPSSLTEKSNWCYNEGGYTVVKGGDFYGAKTGAAKKRTNQLTKLPKQWQQIIDSFDNMEQ